jgi:hypothetical protein
VLHHRVEGDQQFPHAGGQGHLLGLTRCTQALVEHPDHGNEAPRSKLRGITELKHSELPEIFLRLPLPLHIPFNDLPVGPFPYCGHIVPIAPKLPTPQYPLHRRLSAKDLPRRDARESLHNPHWSHFRMRTAEQMNVISVPIASISIGNRSTISAAVSWIIVVTTASSNDFLYFTGNTMW